MPGRGLLTFTIMMAFLVPELQVCAQRPHVSGVVVRPAPPRDGWWLRVNASATDASRIVWRLETLPSAAVETGWWSAAAERPEMYLSSSVARSASGMAVQLAAEQCSPDGCSAAPQLGGSVCVFFKDQGIRLIEFAGQASEQLNATQRDQRCTMAK